MYANELGILITKVLATHSTTWKVFNKQVILKIKSQQKIRGACLMSQKYSWTQNCQTLCYNNTPMATVSKATSYAAKNVDGVPVHDNVTTFDTDLYQVRIYNCFSACISQLGWRLCRCIY